MWWESGQEYAQPKLLDCSNIYKTESLIHQGINCKFWLFDQAMLFDLCWSAFTQNIGRILNFKYKILDLNIYKTESLNHQCINRMLWFWPGHGLCFKFAGKLLHNSIYIHIFTFHESTIHIYEYQWTRWELNHDQMPKGKRENENTKQQKN